jgi:hypothetical protein
MSTSPRFSRLGRQDTQALASASGASPGSADGTPQDEVQPARVLPVCVPRLSAAEEAALELSPAQRLALEKLLSGDTVVASASAAGVTRLTIYNWLKKDAKFQAAYNAWQQDILTSARTRLLAMTSDALTTLSRSVQSEPKVALALLKALGTMQAPVPGSTDPEEVEALMEVEQQEAQNKLDEAKLFASVGFGSNLGKPGRRPSKAEVADLIAMAEREFGG